MLFIQPISPHPRLWASHQAFFTPLFPFLFFFKIFIKAKKRLLSDRVALTRYFKPMKHHPRSPKIQGLFITLGKASI